MALQIIYNTGGMDEFINTGVYPRKLYFIDATLNKKWWRKVNETKNSGTLKIGNKPIYTFNINLETEEINIFDSTGQLITDFEFIRELHD